MSQLSAGQITRVNLAKAFINKPRVLLLDEPTASLDPDIASYIREIIMNYRNDTKATILWTSHNMSEVEEMCDRVIFINKGKVIANDTPDKLARSIQIAHIELLIRDGMKRTIEYCDKHGLAYKLQHRTIIIDVKEKQIAEFLRNLMDAGVMYDEISIEKPTLEDYFLQVAGRPS
jgi:ABC-2 type transport system ATP-binding protein